MTDLTRGIGGAPQMCCTDVVPVLHPVGDDTRRLRASLGVPVELEELGVVDGERRYRGVHREHHERRDDHDERSMLRSSCEESMSLRPTEGPGLCRRVTISLHESLPYRELPFDAPSSDMCLAPAKPSLSNDSPWSPSFQLRRGPEIVVGRVAQCIPQRA